MSFVFAIVGKSFRSLAAPVFPAGNPRKLAVPAVLVALLLAGCGGSKTSVSERHVSGDGYSFRAPSDWTVSRRLRTIVAKSGAAVIQVSVFPQPQPFDPARWEQYVTGTDRAVAQVVEQEKAKLEHSRDSTIAGRRARVYELSRGKSEERLAFFFAGRKEYELFCHDAGSACDALLASFSLAA
jgi:hypothetical protein